MSQAESSPTRAGYAPLNPFSFGLATLAVMLWSGNAVASQFAFDLLPPVFVGAVRFALASVFMILWCFVEGAPVWIVKKEDWWRSFWLGFLLFVQIASFNVGLAYTTSSHATLLVNSYIFWVAIYEQFIQRSIQLRWWQVSGLLLAATGASLLLIDNGPSQSADQVTLFGDLVLAASGFCLAIKIIYTKHAVRFASPGTLILWHDVIGAALMFAWAGCTETIPEVRLSLGTLIGLFYVSIVVSGFCFAANAWLLQRHGASQVSVFSFVTPVCGVILAILFRGDQISIWLVLASILVAVGILLANIGGGQAPSAGAKQFEAEA